MVKPTLDAFEDWTGDRPDGCPFAVFSDEYVARVIALWPAWKERQLAIVCPRPSHREIEGVMHYDRVSAAVEVRQLEEGRKNPEAQHAR